MKALLEGLKALGVARLAAMGAVAIGTLGLLALLMLRGAGGNARMALLYGDLDLRDSAQVVEALDRQHIPHTIEGQGSTILVPADQVAQARLLLAKDGLPSGGSIGYEIFDRTDALTASQFQQTIEQTRAMEGELARSIRMIHGVRQVRVHLVLPKREPFAREQQEAQASVVLTMTGAQRMDRDEVQAVLNLVAGAVPGLKPQNIAVIDSRGDLLARAGAPADAVAGQAATAEELRRAAEQRLSHSVEEMLERTLGAGHVRAEASVDMNFDQLHETEEKFDPDSKVERSTQSVSDNSKTTEKDSTVSVQNSLPTANAGKAGGAGTSDQRQEDTTNYEISKTVRTVVHDQPQIKRISLAVMVDGVTAPGPDGKPVWRERSPEDLKRITALVESAVGYDAKRGDKVEVASMRFASEDAGAEPTPAHSLLGVALDKSDIMHLAETLLFGVVAVLTLLMVLRPMVTRITALPQTALAGGGASYAALGAPVGDDFAAAALGGPAALAALPGPDGNLAALPAPAGGIRLLEDESMVNIGNIEGQLRASSIRKVADLVTKHPDETLAILRGWLMEAA